MFNPKKWMESKLLPAGTYEVRLLNYDKRFLPDGRIQIMLRFEVNGHDEAELVDWWREDNEASMRRAVQAAKLLNPALLEQEFPGQAEFFEAVLKAMDQKWLRAVVTQATRSDGTPASRLRSFVGIVDGLPARRSEAVPF